MFPKISEFTRNSLETTVEEEKTGVNKKRSMFVAVRRSVHGSCEDGDPKSDRQRTLNCIRRGSIYVQNKGVEKVQIITVEILRPKTGRVNLKWRGPEGVRISGIGKNKYSLL